MDLAPQCPVARTRRLVGVRYPHPQPLPFAGKATRTGASARRLREKLPLPPSSSLRSSMSSLAALPAAHAASGSANATSSSSTSSGSRPCRHVGAASAPRRSPLHRRGGGGVDADASPAPSLSLPRSRSASSFSRLRGSLSSRTTTAARSAAASSATPSASSTSVDDAKRALLEALDGTYRGCVATASERAAVEEAQVALESLGSGGERGETGERLDDLDLNLLAGKWRLVYTTVGRSDFQRHPSSLGVLRGPRDTPKKHQKSSLNLRRPIYSCVVRRTSFFFSVGFFCFHLGRTSRRVAWSSRHYPRAADVLTVLRLQRDTGLLEVGDIFQSFTADGKIENEIRLSLPFLLAPATQVSSESSRMNCTRGDARYGRLASSERKRAGGGCPIPPIPRFSGWRFFWLFVFVFLARRVRASTHPLALIPSAFFFFRFFFRRRRLIRNPRRNAPPRRRVPTEASRSRWTRTTSSRARAP